MGWVIGISAWTVVAFVLAVVLGRASNGPRPRH